MDVATVIIVVVVVVGSARLFQHVSELARRIDRLSRVEGKLDALLRHAGVGYDPLAGVPPEVQEALDQGKYILAIKRLRAATGLGLKEAKEQVDELRRRRAASKR
jgi:ribosomal protein L7/L12